MCLRDRCSRRLGVSVNGGPSYFPALADPNDPGRGRSGDGINSAVLETRLGGAGEVLETDLPKTERQGALVSNTPSRASAIESQSTRRKKDFPDAERL
jgi:hypothetical protein